MRRRRFEHLIIELSLALGRRVERYPLWLALRECGFDPESLGASDVDRFCGAPLDAWLDERGWTLSDRRRRRLMRALRRFDPGQPTPEDFMRRLGGDRA